MGLTKQAKVLSKGQIDAVHAYLASTRHPDRNRLIFLLSVKAGLRAKEIASLTWPMVTDAEAKKEELAHLNEASGPVFKIKQDPRITRAGRFIRRSSLDELPQLWNVFRGDMSIVGPRPPVPSEVALYSQHQAGRLAVRPGITCLWQIMGRCNIGFDEWIELDLKYIETMSFWGDVMIVLKTIPAVITGYGAH